MYDKAHAVVIYNISYIIYDSRTRLTPVMRKIMPTINGAVASPFETFRPRTRLPSDRKATSANRITTTPRMVSDAPKKRRKLVFFSTSIE